MFLTDSEKAILSGSEGLARQRAMKLLVKYAIALRADRLIDVDNVGFSTPCPYPASRHADLEFESYEALFNYTHLNSDIGEEVAEIPRVKAGCCCNHATNPNREYLAYLGIQDEKMERGFDDTNDFARRIGVNNVQTCVPHLVGHLASKGQHIVMGESAAVIFFNSVLGARTNVEGEMVGGAAALVGKVPNVGLHLDENRWGTHLILVDEVPEVLYEWDVLGYFIGKRIRSGIPVLKMDVPYISMDAHKCFGATLCTAGAADMYHIIGHTPEAATYELAFGKNTPAEVIHYGAAEKKKTLESLDFSKDENVDLVLVGCPHYTAYQIKRAAESLDNRRCKARLILMTSRTLYDQAKRNGDAEIIEKAGGFIMTDSCPPMVNLWPENSRVIATDSGKMAHYTPSKRSDVSIHMGSMEHCMQAALTGRW